MIKLEDIHSWRIGNYQWDIGPEHTNIVLKDEGGDGYIVVHIGRNGWDRIATGKTPGGYPDWSPGPHETENCEFNATAFIEDYFVIVGTRMPEMDFSLEDMELADKIIEGIEHENA